MKFDIKKRATQLQAKMQARKLDAILLTCDESVYYFSGFMGDETQVLITKDGSFLLTDFRYTEQAEKQTNNVNIIETKGSDRLKKIDALLRNAKVKTLGIEKEYMSLSLYERCLNAFHVDFYESISDEIKEICAIKTKAELDTMQLGAKISDDVYTELLTRIKPGMTEAEVNAELTYLFNLKGLSLSFPSIIASGSNSSLPHAPVTNRKLQNGDLLTLDFGCKYNGYCTDCTRTIGIGTLDSEQKKVYDIVKIAQQKAFDAIKPGITCAELDAVAREYITSCGYGKNFGHSLGHGVGLFIHEFPRVGDSEKTVLKEGMVITIEPGIYLKDKIGVRIEDMCYVTKDGGVSFNKISKDLITIT